MRRDIDLLDDETGSRTKVFHKGTLLYKEGQGSDVAYIVKQGRVAIYRVLHNKRVHLGERGPGDLVGEMGVITAEPRASCAEAMEYTEVLVLDQNLLRTMLLKSPRPVQIITRYLVDRVKTLAQRITDRPSGNLFLSVCRVTALCWQAAGRAGASGLSYVELSRNLKDILLVSQVEIDAIFETLKKLHLIELLEIKQTYFRKDPLLGEEKPGATFVKDRLVRLADADKFLQVAKNIAREYRDRPDFAVDLEFCDLADFAREAGTTPEIIYKKIGYGEIPRELFFFHKAASLDFIAGQDPAFFKQARRPRLTAADLERVDDLTSVDNATLQEVFSALGFHKVAVLAAMAGEEARDKIFRNLSKKIAAVVKEEADSLTELDDAEIADVEKEFLDHIKAIKGLAS